MLVWNNNEAKTKYWRQTRISADVPYATTAYLHPDIRNLDYSINWRLQ